MKEMKKFFQTGRRLVAAVLVLASVLSVLPQPAAKEPEPLCGLSEHTHTDSCYESCLTCSIEGHAHGEECYEIESLLTCTQTHEHDASCYTERAILICEYEEHNHQEDCYEQELICGQQEHTHVEACYLNLGADVETAEAWEATLPLEELTGDWSKDLLLVAQSQLGYEESVYNFTTDEDGTRHGYTRYGAWYGMPYEDWCAMYVMFCLHYAGIPSEASYAKASCPRWVQELTKEDLLTSPVALDQIEPGDLLFEDLLPDDGAASATHVSIVERVDLTNGVIYVYEGNFDNQVQRIAYLLPSYTGSEELELPDACLRLTEDEIIGSVSLSRLRSYYVTKYGQLLPTRGINNRELPEDPFPEEAVNHKITFMVMRDNQWEAVGYLDQYHYSAEMGSTYITAEEAEYFFGEYGYTAQTAPQQMFGFCKASDVCYNICPATSTDYCLDIKNGSVEDGGSLQLYECNNTEAQLFRLVDVTTTDENGNTVKNGNVFLRNVKSGRNINVYYGRVQYNVDNALVQHSATDACSHWRIERDKDGYYIFHTARNDKYVIDLDSGTLANSTKVHLWPGASTGNKRWQLKEVYQFWNRGTTRTVNGTVKIGLSAVQTEDLYCFYMPAAGNNASYANGGFSNNEAFRANNICRVSVDESNLTGGQTTFYLHSSGTRSITINNASNYTWRVADENGNLVNNVLTVSGNTLTVKNVTSNLRITPAQSAATDPVTAKKVTFRALVNDKWVDMGTQAYYYYTGSGRAYVTSSQAEEMFAKLGYTSETHPGYTFGHSLESSKRYFLTSALDTSYAIGVNSFKTADGSVVSLHKLSEYVGANQVFSLPAAEYGRVYIRPFIAEGTSINVHGGTLGRQLVIHSASDYNSQWRQADRGSGKISFLAGQNEGYAIDLSGGTLAHGQPVQTWTVNYSDAQSWILKETQPIWNDNGYTDSAADRRVGEDYKVYISTTGSQNCYLYYLPNISSVFRHAVPDSVGGTVYSYWAVGDGYPKISIKENGFYTVDIVDENHEIYTNDELESLRQYVRYGQDRTVTLDFKQDCVWYLVYADGRIQEGENIGDKVVFQVKNLTAPARIELKTTNPSYTVGYFADVQELDQSGGVESLNVLDTNGLDTATADMPTNSTIKTKTININDNGTVRWKDVNCQIYADATYSYFNAPSPYYIDIATGFGNYELDSLTVYSLGVVQKFEHTANRVVFTNTPSQMDATHAFITDGSYVKVDYKRTESKDAVVSAEFFDYSITSGDYFIHSYPYGNSAGFRNKGVNNDDKYIGSGPYYVFGAAGIAFDSGAAGVMLHAGDTYNNDRINLSNKNNSFGCMFGLPATKLVDHMIQLNCRYPSDLFTPGTTDGQWTREGVRYYGNFKLNFSQTGDRYTLTSVTGGRDGALTNLDRFTKLCEKAYGTGYIWSNNFWPMDDSLVVPNKNFNPQSTSNGVYDMWTGKTGNTGILGYHIAGENGKIHSTQYPTSDDGQYHNALFGMHTQIEFEFTEEYIGPLEYLIYGDDDLWVYLEKVGGTTSQSGSLAKGDNTLVCDLGGVHSSVGEYVNLRDYIRTGDCGKYILHIFFTERGFSGSTCYMYFTLPGMSQRVKETTVSTVTLTNQVANIDGYDGSFTYVFHPQKENSDGSLEPLSSGIYSFAKRDVNGRLLEGGNAFYGYTFTLKNGEYITFTGVSSDTFGRIEFLQYNVEGFTTVFTVKPDSVDSSITGQTGQRYDVDAEAVNNRYTVVNRWRTTDVKVENRVNCLVDIQDVFTYQFLSNYVNSSGTWVDQVSQSYPIKYYNAQGTLLTNTGRPATVKHGDYISLKQNEYAVIQNVPWGASFRSGFVQSACNQSYSTSMDVTHTLNPVEISWATNGRVGRYLTTREGAANNHMVFINTRLTTKVTLKNEVSGGRLKSDQKFPYRLLFWDSTNASSWTSCEYKTNAGGTKTKVAYPYTKSNGTRGSIGMGEDIFLSPGESLTFDSLPYGSNFKMEFVLDNGNSYGITDEFNITMTKPSGSAIYQVSWLPSRACGLTLSKTETENTIIYSNVVKPTSFSVTANLEGYKDDNPDIYYQLILWNGASTVNSTNEWNLLDRTLSYKVTNASGGTVSTGSLSPAQTTDAAFVVSGSCSTANTYVFSLKHGQTSTFTDIPLGAYVEINQITSNLKRDSAKNLVLSGGKVQLDSDGIKLDPTCVIRSAMNGYKQGVSGRGQSNYPERMIGGIVELVRDSAQNAVVFNNKRLIDISFENHVSGVGRPVAENRSYYFRVMKKLGTDSYTGLFPANTQYVLTNLTTGAVETRTVPASGLISLKNNERATFRDVVGDARWIQIRQYLPAADSEGFDITITGFGAVSGSAAKKTQETLDGVTYQGTCSGDYALDTFPRQSSTSFSDYFKPTSFSVTANLEGYTADHPDIYYQVILWNGKSGVGGSEPWKTLDNYTLTYTVSGVSGEKTIAPGRTNDGSLIVKGSAAAANSYVFALKAGQTATFTNLPVGAYVEVVQLTSDLMRDANGNLVLSGGKVQLDANGIKLDPIWETRQPISGYAQGISTRAAANYPARSAGGYCELVSNAARNFFVFRSQRLIDITVVNTVAGEGKPAGDNQPKYFRIVRTRDNANLFSAGTLYIHTDKNGNTSQRSLPANGLIALKNGEKATFTNIVGDATEIQIREYVLPAERDWYEISVTGHGAVSAAAAVKQNETIGGVTYSGTHSLAFSLNTSPRQFTTNFINQVKYTTARITAEFAGNTDPATKLYYQVILWNGVSSVVEADAYTALSRNLTCKVLEGTTEVETKALEQTTDAAFMVRGSKAAVTSYILALKPGQTAVLQNIPVGTYLEITQLPSDLKRDSNNALVLSKDGKVQIDEQGMKLKPAYTLRSPIEGAAQQDPTDRVQNCYPERMEGAMFEAVFDDTQNYIAFTNERVAKLQITKTVTGTWLGSEKSYDFRVVNAANGSLFLTGGTEYTVTHADKTTETRTLPSTGVFSLKNGETATIADIVVSAGMAVKVVELLPVEDYAIYSVRVTGAGATAQPQSRPETIAAANDFYGFYSATIDLNRTPNAVTTFDNTLKKLEEYYGCVLSISKELERWTLRTDAPETYEMYVTLDGTALPVGTTYYARKQDSTERTEETVTQLGVVVVPENGSVYIPNILPGTAYSVTELHAENFVATYTDASGVLHGGGTDAGRTKESTVHNVEMGSVCNINLRQTVVNGDDARREVRFNVYDVKGGTVSYRGCLRFDVDYKALTYLPYIALSTNYINGTSYEKIRITQEATYDGERNQYVRFDTTYYDVDIRIEKQNGERFEATVLRIEHFSPSGTSLGTIAVDAPCQFDNVRLGNLSISQSILGDTTGKELTFKLHLTNSSTAVAGSYTIYNGGTASTLTVDENGDATVKIKSGNTLEIVGLPAGTLWQVEELVDGCDTTYVVDDGGTTPGTISAGWITYAGTSRVAYTNEPVN